MSYILTVGYLQLFPAEAQQRDEYTCEQAKRDCSPTYVFSIMGQVGFRASLDHLAVCQKQHCRELRTKVIHGMRHKLQWLFDEESMLGCVHIQPFLYGTRRVLLDRKQFPYVAAHLADCPRESCAQLRRALLLSVRDKVRPIPVLTSL